MCPKMRFVQILSAKAPEELLYDLVVEFPVNDTEFAVDFFQKARERKAWRSIEEFIAQNAQNVKIRTVKIMTGGMLLASVPFTSLTAIEAKTRELFSISYLYGGTAAEQIQQVRSAKEGLDAVSPGYFKLLPDGELKAEGINETFISAMHEMQIRVVPFLSNHWNQRGVRLALQKPEVLAGQLAGYVMKNDLDGINVHLTNMTSTDREAYTKMVSALRKELPPEKELSVAVAPIPKQQDTGWEGSYDYTALAEQADYLILMTYDEHHQGGEPGPLAGLQWVEQSIRYALQHTRREKIVLGVPFFGRLWSQDGAWKGNGLTLNQIVSMLQAYNASVSYDVASQSAKAVFTVQEEDKTYIVGGKTLTPGMYTVWYENDRSLKAKTELIHKYGLKGIGSWALGLASLDIRETMQELAGSAVEQKAASLKRRKQMGSVIPALLNVREGPGMEYAVMEMLHSNHEVELLGPSSQGWYPVEFGKGKTGYVMAEYIMVSSSGVPLQEKLPETDSLEDNIQREMIPDESKSSPIIEETEDRRSNTLTSRSRNGSKQMILHKRGRVKAPILNICQSSCARSRMIARERKGHTVPSRLGTIESWYSIKRRDSNAGYVRAGYRTVK